MVKRMRFFSQMLMLLFAGVIVAHAQTDVALLARNYQSPIQQHVVRSVQQSLDLIAGYSSRVVSSDSRGVTVDQMTAVFDDGSFKQRQQLAGALGSQLLVLVDTIEQEGNAAVQLAVVEPSVGLRLNTAILQWDPGQPQASAAAITDEILFAHAKAKGGIKAVFAVPPFESKDLSQKYTFMMDAYAAWVEQLLLNQAGVVLVELKEAEQLAQMYRGKRTPARPYVLSGHFRNQGVGLDRRIDVGLSVSRDGRTLASKSQENLAVEKVANEIYVMLYELLSLSASDELVSGGDQSGAHQKLMERADALGSIGFWDHAIPLYHALLLRDEFSEPATLGLMEAYSVLLRRSMKARRDNPEIVPDLCEKIVDLAATIRPDWDVSDKNRMRDALRTVQTHGHLSILSEHPSVAAQARINAAKWELAQMAYGALTAPNMPFQIGQSPRDLIYLVQSGAFGWYKTDEPAAYALWLGALEAIEGHRRALTLRISHMMQSQNWRKKSLDAENKEIALAARIATYLSEMDPEKSEEEHRAAIQQIEGFDALSRSDASVVYAYFPDQLKERKFRNKDRKTIVTGASGTLVSNMTAEILSVYPVAPSRAIQDWIHTDGLEFLSTDEGVYEVAGLGSFRKMSEEGADRIWWDGQNLWCFSSSGIRVLAKTGKEKARYRADNLPFPLVSEYMHVVPLEFGWVCLVGAEKINGVRRTWIAGLDARNADDRNPPEFNVLYEGIAQKQTRDGGDVAFLPYYAVRFGSASRYRVLTGGFYLSKKLMIDVAKRDVYPYGRSKFDARHMVQQGNVSWATSSEFGQGQQNWTIWRWPEDEPDAVVWHHQKPYRYESGGVGRGMFRYVFLHDNQLHLICHAWRFPAWFSVDLSSKRVAVVADTVPDPFLNDDASYRFVSSSAYGLVGLGEGQAHRVELAPPETLPEFVVSD